MIEGSAITLFVMSPLLIIAYGAWLEYKNWRSKR